MISTCDISKSFLTPSAFGPLRFGVIVAWRGGELLNATMKTCSRCKLYKAKSEFWVDRRNNTLRSKCKKCCTVEYRKYAEKNRELLREKSRNYFYRNRLKRYAYIKTIDPVKVRARQAVVDAVRRGKITKPKRCPICNRKAVLHGHHRDYTKRLDVEWSCSICHGVKHRKILI